MPSDTELREQHTDSSGAQESALFSTTNYSFDTSKSSTYWKVLNLTSGDVSLWKSGSGISEIAFAGEKPTSFIYLNGSNADGDGVSLYWTDATTPGKASLLASLPGPYSGLKAATTKSGDINFIVYAKAWPNGTVYNEETAATPKSSGRMYTSIYVRHWDYWLSDAKNAIFGGVLKKANNGSYTFDGKLTNFVTGIKNITVAESPLDLDGSEDYDLSPDGTKIAFLTKDINLPLANYTSSQIYLVPFSGSAKDAVPINPRGSAKYPATQGASSSPAFSPDSQYISWTQMDGIAYESDRARLYTACVTSGKDFSVTRLAGNWDRSPGLSRWSPDSKTIYVSAPDLGRQRVFPIPADATDGYMPYNITNEGVPSDMSVLPNGKILISDSKIWSSRDFYTVSPDGKETKVYLQANKVDPELKGLKPEDVSEFYYSTNTSEIKQQSWIIYPEGFDKTKKYPLAFIVHGGPQGAHYNSWSTRWNFKVWADQGYVSSFLLSLSTLTEKRLTEECKGRHRAQPDCVVRLGPEPHGRHDGSMGQLHVL